MELKYYKLTDCIKKQLNPFMTVKEIELFSKCNVPWTLDMLERPVDAPTPCNITDAAYQSLKLMEFIYKATRYTVSGCKGIACYNIQMPWHIL